MEGINSIIHSKSKTFLAFCFCFLAGVAGTSVTGIKINFLYLYISLFIFLSCLVLFWSNTSARFLTLCLLCVSLGIARYLLAFPLQFGDHIANHAGEKMELTGFISAEPDVRTDGVRYIVTLRTPNSELRTSPRGNVYLKSYLYPRYAYGDSVHLSCKIQKPEPIEDFHYDMYLARYGVFAVCRNAYMTKIGDGEGYQVMRYLLGIKHAIADRVELLWHEPYAAFMAGLLYGYRGGLLELNELFSKTGVTHIVAVSGYNITIIASLFINLCIAAYIPRKKAFWLVTAGIAAFVLFTGASGSVVRAGIMGILALVATQAGRLSQAGYILAGAAALMVLHNPFVLVWDAGFQLSFLSTLGLVYLSPFIEPFLRLVPEAFKARESLTQTFSAILVTLPLVLYQFGRLSLVAPLVNVLVVWLLPFLMMTGAVTVIAGLAFLPLGRLAAWIPLAGMAYIVAIVQWFGSLPLAAVNIRLPWWGMAGMYILLGFWIAHRTRMKRV